MLQVNVTLPSGRSASISVFESSKVSELRVVAQKALGQGGLKLVAADGHVVNPSDSVSALGLEDGDHLNAIVQETSWQPLKEPLPSGVLEVIRS